MTGREPWRWILERLIGFVPLTHAGDEEHPKGVQRIGLVHVSHQVRHRVQPRLPERKELGRAKRARLMKVEVENRKIRREEKNVRRRCCGCKYADTLPHETGLRDWT